VNKYLETEFQQAGAWWVAIPLFGHTLTRLSPPAAPPTPAPTAVNSRNGLQLSSSCVS